MYANSGALQSYGEAARTVSAGRQVVMLYDGILGCLREARVAIEDGRIADRFNALKKACDIVHGLSSCIDFANGGEVAPIAWLATSPSIDSQPGMLPDSASAVSDNAAWSISMK